MNNYLSLLSFVALILSFDFSAKAGELPLATSGGAAIVMRPFSDQGLIGKMSSGEALRNLFDPVDEYENLIKPLDEFNYAPLVYHGDPVNPAEFPGLLWFVTEREKCSASQVGPQVILTAAHCLKYIANDDIANVLIEDKGGQFRASCFVNPEYELGIRGNVFPDWAICLLDRPRQISRYESLHLEPLPLDAKVVIAGYGCTHPGEELRNNFTLAMGEARIFEPVPGNREEFTYVYDRRVVACEGDSGGPAFLGHRGGAVVGVISVSRYARGLTGVSGFANEAFARFYGRWLEKLEEEPAVCGLNSLFQC